jgi:hypothetical protein
MTDGNNFSRKTVSGDRNEEKNDSSLIFFRDEKTPDQDVFYDKITGELQGLA